MSPPLFAPSETVTRPGGSCMCIVPGTTLFALCDAYHLGRWNSMDVMLLSRARRTGSGGRSPRDSTRDGARVVASDREADALSVVVDELNAGQAEQRGRRARRHRHRSRQPAARRSGRGRIRPDRSVLRQRRRRGRHRPRRHPRPTGSWPSTSTSTPTAGRRSISCRAGSPAARATSARRHRPPVCSARSARRRTR